MQTQRVKITEGGKIALPAEFRRKLGLAPGDTLVVELADGELRVRSLSSAIARSQTLYAKHVGTDRSLADELIAERRAEAETE